MKLKGMNKMNFYDELVWRGLIKDTAGENIKDVINKGGFTFYWGTDPTADSLHLGHYSSLVTAKRLAKMGNHPLLLIGGATGLIGDPRPTSEREIITKEAVNKNIEGIKKQITSLFKGNVEIVNNYDWMKDYTYLDFLRDVGKYINVNYMINKDIIARRLDTGITYAEFSYTLIQGYDFLHLFKEKNCIMQAEGSDQWGNITTGIDLIKKITGKDAYAFTMPLVLDKFGNKFGKSMGNALWLDESKTSSYELYQYLINVDDDMVINYLKIFTFLSKEEIEVLSKSNKDHPELREAQKALAKEIITDIHGEESYNKAINISKALFSEDINKLSSKDIMDSLKDVNNVSIKEGNIVDVLVESGVFTSKREARELILGNALTINNVKINSLDYVITKDILIDNKLLVIRKGKKNYYIGIME
jgi:tyrosyl-tRNA synthetase